MGQDDAVEVVRIVLHGSYDDDMTRMQSKKDISIGSAMSTRKCMAE